MTLKDKLNSDKWLKFHALGELYDVGSTYVRLKFFDDLERTALERLTDVRGDYMSNIDQFGLEGGMLFNEIPRSLAPVLVAYGLNKLSKKYNIGNLGSIPLGTLSWACGLMNNAVSLAQLYNDYFN